MKATGETTGETAGETAGVCWIPALEVLGRRGFEVVLAGARDAEPVP